MGPTLIIALHSPRSTSTAPAHWRTSRTSNEIARMGLPEITNHQLDLKLPTPLGTQVTACPPGALLWQNAKRCTRQCAACGCDIKKNQIQIFQRYSSHENVGSSTSRFYSHIFNSVGPTLIIALHHPLSTQYSSSSLENQSAFERNRPNGPA